MNLSQAQSIQSIYNRTERDFGDRSNEFILEAVCSRAFMQHGWELEHSDVLEALELLKSFNTVTPTVPLS